jgi:predicted MFS family arabinose efflux permease
LTGLVAARWSLLLGNFAIGTGVMVVAGTLNDLSRSLDVAVPLAGQLIAIAAAVMCFGAPLLAGWVAAFDRRRLLMLALLWYAAGHALCALMPSYATLWPVRALTMLGAAVFTPQAAAAIGFMAPSEQRGRHITFIFLGWSVASVIGIPMSAWLGETQGWRVAFAVVAGVSVAAAAGVFATLPDGVKPAALSRQAWKDLFTHPVLMAMVAVTALQSAGQFTLFSYMAPYYKQVLGATPGQITLLFAWFGAFGLIGNLLLSRWIDRVGAGRAVAFTLALVVASLLLWPLALGFVSTALVLVPWALGCFASNSAQQARLGLAAPALASALMALNTSAMYLGQAAGASSGGWLLDHGGFAPLSWIGSMAVLIAIALSLWVGRQNVRRLA